MAARKKRSDVVERPVSAFDLELLVMDAIVRGESYGRGIWRGIRNRAPYFRMPSVQRVYAALVVLEDSELARSHLEETKGGLRLKLYRLTRRGVAYYGAVLGVYDGLKDAPPLPPEEKTGDGG